MIDRLSSLYIIVCSVSRIMLPTGRVHKFGEWIIITVTGNDTWSHIWTLFLNAWLCREKMKQTVPSRDADSAHRRPDFNSWVILQEGADNTCAHWHSQLATCQGWQGGGRFHPLLIPNSFVRNKWLLYDAIYTHNNQAPMLDFQRSKWYFFLAVLGLRGFL